MIILVKSELNSAFILIFLLAIDAFQNGCIDIIHIKKCVLQHNFILNISILIVSIKMSSTLYIKNIHSVGLTLVMCSKKYHEFAGALERS